MEYQSMTSSIKFLVTGTRPDLAWCCGMLSTFNAAPAERHVDTAKQVLRYIRYTADYSLKFTRTHSGIPMTLEIYMDASFNQEPHRVRSFAGYVMMLDRCPVAWSSKRQATVAKSTAEAEYVAIATAASHLLWSITAMKDLGVRHELPVLRCDNEPAIHLTSDARINTRMKHIAVHYHFVRERIGLDFTVNQVASEANLADICTKALPRPTLRALVDTLKLPGS